MLDNVVIIRLSWMLAVTMVALCFEVWFGRKRKSDRLKRRIVQLYRLSGTAFLVAVFMLICIGTLVIATDVFGYDRQPEWSTDWIIPIVAWAGGPSLLLVAWSWCHFPGKEGDRFLIDQWGILACRCELFLAVLVFLAACIACGLAAVVAGLDWH